MKNTSFQIRRAVPEDALGIAIVRVYTWKTTYTGLIPDTVIDGLIRDLSQIGEHLRASIETNHHYLVAVINGTVVGFCCFTSSRNNTYPDSGELTALYVLKGFQGQGIGKALLLAGAEQLRNMGYRSMIVNCLKGNPSLAFYQRMGGKIVADRQDILDGATLAEHIVYFESLLFHTQKEQPL